MIHGWKPGGTILQFGDTTVEVLGDQHLGRSFMHGVPPHRRGEREIQQKLKFRESLLKTTANLHVNMGDIFDKFVVSPTIVLFAAKTYKEAAEKNPETMYVLIMGNHDGSRDTTMKSSFDLLKALLYGVENIMIVSEAPEVVETENQTFAFVPWNAFKTAKEMAEDLLGEQPDAEFTAVFGHWDVDDFGNENPNLIPTAELSNVTTTLVTGHVHKPEYREIDGVDVVVTGSMLPYAHGEDHDNSIYRTVTLEEANQLVESGEAKNLCLRVMIDPEEEFDFEIDCLQLQVQRGKAEEISTAVEFETFYLKTLFDTTCAESGVSSGLTGDMWSRLRESNPDME